MQIELHDKEKKKQKRNKEQKKILMTRSYDSHFARHSLSLWKWAARSTCGYSTDKHGIDGEHDAVSARFVQV